MRTDLERFFNPESIAIVGASQDLSTISGQPLKFLKSHGYGGRLYPVNPRYAEVAGTRCYPSVAALPEVPELALVLVNAARVADVLEQCGAAGVPYAIVFSSGFAEMGGAGETRQAAIAAIARRHGIGVVGPNCQGMISVANRVFAGFGSVFNADYEPGTVSMVSQSGGFGFSVMNLVSKDGGVPFRQVVTTGNEIGVSTVDFLDYYVRDAGTTLIVAYAEGLADAGRLRDTGVAALRAGKPILMWKSGDTEHGRRAARAHTANRGAAPEAWEAVFRDSGIIRVEDIQDVADYGRAFGCGKLPAGNRLAIITISGGAGILMTDECIRRGMELPALSEATRERLRGFVPEFGSLLNPVDVTASIFNQTDLVARALEAVLGDPAVDCVAMLNASLQGELAVQVAQQIAAAAAATPKPVFVAWSAREAVSADAYGLLDAARIPHFRSPVRCGRAIAAVAAFADARRRLA
ncbi:MAG: CoA-binding protein [Burkholderiales bacterium]|nr:CoA-binding protein [Burkholderiales bacterium]